MYIFHLQHKKQHVILKCIKVDHEYLDKNTHLDILISLQMRFILISIKMNKGSRHILNCHDNINHMCNY